MNIDLTRNYFELFGIPESFEVDLHALADKNRAYQAALHPDRYTNASDQERRMSVQTTAYVNEAYATLKSDLKRAHYLLKLKDIDFNSDSETSNDTEFLMQQMEMHDRIEEVDQANDPLSTLDSLAKELKQQQADLISQFSAQYSENNLSEAKHTALKLQFYERLTNQVRKKQEYFEEQLL